MIDISKAEKILGEYARSLPRPTMRKLARPAAEMLRDDMRQGSGGIVPIWTAYDKKGRLRRWHSVRKNKTGYVVWIKRGNLRKSHHVFVFKKSPVLWVGPRYLKNISGKDIGTTFSNASGFYDKMYIRKTGNEFHTRALRKNEGALRQALYKEVLRHMNERARRLNKM